MVSVDSKYRFIWVISLFPEILIILQFLKHQSFTGKSQRTTLYPIWEDGQVITLLLVGN